MLEFNESHKSISGDIKTKGVKRKNILIAGTFLSVFLFAGCAKTVDCEITGLHAHNYVSISTFDRYVVSEREKMGLLDEWYRTDEYISIDEETKKIIEFEKKHDLFRISDNKDVIDKLISSQNDFTVYEYEYTYMQPIPHTMKVGKTTTFYYTYIPIEKEAWTNNPNNDSLTGEEKTAHYLYWGYKIVKNEKGKLEVVKSDYVESLDELPEEYIYIKHDFYKVVNLDNFEEEITYHDDLGIDKSINNIKSNNLNQSTSPKTRRRKR